MLCTPIVDSQYKNAANTTFVAILENTEVKKELNLVSKTGEHIFWKYSPLTEAQLTYAVWTGPIITGQITTKPIVVLKLITKDGFTIRPDLEYNYRTDQSYSALLTITRGF